MKCVKAVSLLAIVLVTFVIPMSAFAVTATPGGSAVPCGPSNNGNYACPGGQTCRTVSGPSGSSGTCVAVTITATPGGSKAGQPSGNTTLKNPLGAGTSLNALLADILQFVVRIGSIVVILMLVYVGFLFVVARGNPGEISKARNALLWTIIGALVLLGAEAIAQGIQATVQALSSGG